MNKSKNNRRPNISLGSLGGRRETTFVAFARTQSEHCRVVGASISSFVVRFTILLRASLSGWLQRRCQVIPSVGLFFNGFLKEIKTAADGAVTGVTTVRGSVGRPVAVVAVVAVMAVVAMVAVVAVLALVAVVAVMAVVGVVAVV